MIYRIVNFFHQLICQIPNIERILRVHARFRSIIMLQRKRILAKIFNLFQIILFLTTSVSQISFRLPLYLNRPLLNIYDVLLCVWPIRIWSTICRFFRIFLLFRRFLRKTTFFAISWGTSRVHSLLLIILERCAWLLSRNFDGLRWFCGSPNRMSLKVGRDLSK